MDAQLRQIAKNNKELGYIACIRDLLDLDLISGQTSSALLEKLDKRF